ncbi:MAG: DMT family transporter [Clostridiales Family XIII bacterium]|jgi:drug/metabolite transporter (DMT)-like permease|nr:DMT family transporter [Clostridiales Family XIII bacterium]
MATSEKTEKQIRRRNVALSSSILAFTAFLWGMGFVSQRAGMEHVGPFFFSGARMILGAAVIALTIVVMNTIQKARRGKPEAAGEHTAEPSQAPATVRELLKGGMACGAILFFAGNSQQVGIVFTTASKAGFLTALYIVLVPILGIFLKHKTHWNTWVSVLIAAGGLYFLCITEGLHIKIGDLVILIGSIGWASHILVIDHFVSKFGQTDVIRLCALQFLFAGIFAFICAPFADPFFVKESLTAEALQAVMVSLLYAGIVSSGIGFTLQAVGQRYANPSAAAILMSLESVFAVIGGMLILHEKMSGREILGCGLMFLAVILAQLPVGGNETPTAAEGITDTSAS